MPQSSSGQKGVTGAKICPGHLAAGTAELKGRSRNAWENEGQAGRGPVRGGGPPPASPTSTHGIPGGPGRSLGGEASGVGRLVSQQTGSGHFCTYVRLWSSSGITGSISAPRGGEVGLPLPAVAGARPQQGGLCYPSHAPAYALCPYLSWLWDPPPPQGSSLCVLAEFPWAGIVRAIGAHLPIQPAPATFLLWTEDKEALHPGLYVTRVCGIEGLLSLVQGWVCCGPQAKWACNLLL